MRTLFAVIVTAATVLIPACGLAKGGYVGLPPVHVIAAVPLVVPQSLPNISAHEALGGCGTHRQRDPETQRCRGPGNF
jgi:hypothetical protein